MSGTAGAEAPTPEPIKPNSDVNDIAGTIESIVQNRKYAGVRVTLLRPHALLHEENKCVPFITGPLLRYKQESIRER